MLSRQTEDSRTDKYRNLQYLVTKQPYTRSCYPIESLGRHRSALVPRGSVEHIVEGYQSQMYLGEGLTHKE